MILDRLRLNRQANLFDSWYYVMKSFLGIMTGYVLFSTNSIVGRDMISLLFGMMLCLEPVNASGVKSGISQFKATIIGGIITAIIVSIGGVNFVTVPLGVALTIYISLQINWREVPVIAIFTAIYMTQYIQLNEVGEISMLLTFRLRMLSLATGVLIALVYNYIFSKLFYKGMFEKRTIYIFETLIGYMEQFKEMVERNDVEGLQSLKGQIPSLFQDIDFVQSHLLDLNKEKSNLSKFNSTLDLVKYLRDFNHYFFDSLLSAINGDVTEDYLKVFSGHMEKLEILKDSYLSSSEGYQGWSRMDTGHKTLMEMDKIINEMKHCMKV